MKFYTIAIFLISSLFITSCTVVGEVDPLKKIDLKGKELSRITGGFKHKRPNRTMTGVPSADDEDIFITAIDGKKLFRMAMSTEFPSSMLITPGKHKIDVKYAKFGLFSYGTLWLDAEKEKEYIVKYKTHKYSVSFWLEDASTGKIVGSVFGEDVEEKNKN